MRLRNKVAVITGGASVLHAAEMLEKAGSSCRVVSMHTIKPIDRKEIADKDRRNPL